MRSLHLDKYAFRITMFFNFKTCTNRNVTKYNHYKSSSNNAYGKTEVMGLPLSYLMHGTIFRCCTILTQQFIRWPRLAMLYITARLTRKEKFIGVLQLFERSDEA